MPFPFLLTPTHSVINLYTNGKVQEKGGSGFFSSSTLNDSKFKFTTICPGFYIMNAFLCYLKCVRKPSDKVITGTSPRYLHVNTHGFDKNNRKGEPRKITKSNNE